MKHYTLEEILEMYPEAIVYDPATEKESLLKDLKGKAGVYLWFNIESGDYYIGSSVNLCNRFRL
jgi:hypothetical protein